MASRAEWSDDSLCREDTAPDPGELVSDEEGESSLEGTDNGGGALDEDSLRALENVIRQATQLLEAARPKKRRKTGGH